MSDMGLFSAQYDIVSDILCNYFSHWWSWGKNFSYSRPKAFI